MHTRAPDGRTFRCAGGCRKTRSHYPLLCEAQTLVWRRAARGSCIPSPKKPSCNREARRAHLRYDYASTFQRQICAMHCALVPGPQSDTYFPLISPSVAARPTPIGILRSTSGNGLEGSFTRVDVDVFVGPTCVGLFWLRCHCQAESPTRICLQKQKRLGFLGCHC